jgi:hypothetical protein
MFVTILFQLSALISIQLIALIAAIFLFVYIKKQDLIKWYAFIAVSIIGVILFIMLATFIGVMSMAGRHHRNSENQGDGFNRREMRYHWRSHHDRYDREEGNYGHEGDKEWRNEDVKEESEGRMGKDFHHRHMHEKSDWAIPEDRNMEVRDSIMKSKTFKK